jgi:hypothetical protein
MFAFNKENSTTESKLEPFLSHSISSSSSPSSKNMTTLHSLFKTQEDLKQHLIKSVIPDIAKFLDFFSSELWYKYNEDMEKFDTTVDGTILKEFLMNSIFINKQSLYSLIGTSNVYSMPKIHKEETTCDQTNDSLSFNSQDSSNGSFKAVKKASNKALLGNNKAKITKPFSFNKSQASSKIDWNLKYAFPKYTTVPASLKSDLYGAQLFEDEISKLEKKTKKL